MPISPETTTPLILTTGARHLTTWCIPLFSPWNKPRLDVVPFHKNIALHWVPDLRFHTERNRMMARQRELHCSVETIRRVESWLSIELATNNHCLLLNFCNVCCHTALKLTTNELQVWWWQRPVTRVTHVSRCVVQTATPHDAIFYGTQALQQVEGGSITLLNCSIISIITIKAMLAKVIIH